ncbi:MAG: ribosomal protein S18-alanine N-acetyltransferase [Hydrogenibacillus sp.]|nr:ribosomal protein S18-alanine N-acetyltransferase [Hydrogenibacillus sp.]
MTEADVSAVAALDRLVFTLPWSEASFRHEVVHNPLARYVVLEDDGAIIGYAGMWLVFDEAHVTNIAVHPAHRGRGYGARLLKHLTDIARDHSISKMTLEVRASNAVARRLYAKFGFRAAGLRPGYYEDTGEDAIIMWADLAEPSAAEEGSETRSMRSADRGLSRGGDADGAAHFGAGDEL